MTEARQPYSSSIVALGLLGLLYVAQLLVADLIGILRRHTPGTPVVGNHDDFLFRATRAHANTTESIGAVILIAGFAVIRGGDPAWVNGAVWVVLLSRAAHTFSYYLDFRPVRSVAFAVGIAALFSLFARGLRGA